MATLGERVATLEADFRNMADDVRRLDQAIGDRKDPDSIRGRLHKLESVAAAAVLRRNLGVGLLKGWERSVLVLCAVATVAASWYAALGH